MPLTAVGWQVWLVGHSADWPGLALASNQPPRQHFSPLDGFRALRSLSLFVRNAFGSGSAAILLSSLPKRCRCELRFGQQQPVKTRMFHQPSAGLDQALLLCLGGKRPTGVARLTLRSSARIYFFSKSKKYCLGRNWKSLISLNPASSASLITCERGMSCSGLCGAWALSGG